MRNQSMQVNIDEKGEKQELHADYVIINKFDY
jgi:hypothetical protein